MIYIDKHINLEEGNQYSADYLYDSFDENEECFYPSIASKQAYSNFSHKKYRYGIGLGDNREGFEPLLVKEQEGRCCYCMGRIVSGNIALEHIIPRSFKENQNPHVEFQYYANYAPILSENVELATDFSNRKLKCRDDITQIRKFPHIISYTNLVASCHGIIDKKNGTSCFCNHPRGNKRIIPLMLMPDSILNVKYDKLGTMIFTGFAETEIKDTIKALQLNNETLQEIRMLWYKISRTNKTIANITSITQLKDKISLLKEIFNIDDYTQLEEKWKNYAPIPKPENIQEHETVYWNLFIKYDWFYEYYKKNYPIMNPIVDSAISN